MNKFLHQWGRKAGLVGLSLYLTMVLVLWTIQFLGFDTSNCIIDDIDGVNVKVFHARLVDARKYGEGIFKDHTLRIGLRREYKWTERFGRVLKTRHVIQIVGNNLEIDGRQYGSVAQGDSIVIDVSGGIKINDAVRIPSSPEAPSN